MYNQTMEYCRGEGPPLPWVYGSIWSELHSWVPSQNIKEKGLGLHKLTNQRTYFSGGILLNLLFLFIVHSNKERNKKRERERTKMKISLQGALSL